MKILRGRARDELTSLEQRRAEFADRLERQPAAIEEARRAVDEAQRLEASALIDDPDSAAANDARRDAETRLAAAMSELDVLRRAALELELRIEAKTNAARAGRREEETAKHLAGLKRRNDDAATLNALLEQASTIAERLERGRAGVDATRARMCELADDRFSDPGFAEEDEPLHPDGLERLVEMINAGPRRPRATAQHEREKDEEQRARAQRRIANELISKAGEMVPGRPLREAELARLDEPLRSETIVRIDACRAERREALERLGVEFERVETGI